MQYSSKQSLYVKKHYIREKLGLTGSRSQSKNIILLVLGGDTVTATNNSWVLKLRICSKSMQK